MDVKQTQNTLSDANQAALFRWVESTINNDSEKLSITCVEDFRDGLILNKIVNRVLYHKFKHVNTSNKCALLDYLTSMLNCIASEGNLVITCSATGILEASYNNVYIF
jgi:hypothetical protein